MFFMVFYNITDDDYNEGIHLHRYRNGLMTLIYIVLRNIDLIFVVLICMLDIAV